MGLIRHDAIIVTSGLENECIAARNLASSLGLQCTSIVVSVANGYASFLIAPDGGKEGWQSSDVAIDARRKFCELSKGKRWYWVHVAYSYDLDFVKIVGNNVLDNGD